LAKAVYYSPPSQLKLWASQEEVNLNSINPAVRFIGICWRSVETTDLTGNGSGEHVAGDAPTLWETSHNNFYIIYGVGRVIQPNEDADKTVTEPKTGLEPEKK